MLKQSFLKLWQIIKKATAAVLSRFSRLIHSWPKLFAAAIVLIVLAYYPLGGLFSENIDRSEDIPLEQEHPMQSSSLQTMAFLIDREVNRHIWTPNLPLVFPSYFLDNMPNFQTGIMSAIGTFTRLAAPQMQCETGSREQNYIVDAGKLLAYPGNIWLFAPDNRLKTAPSSSAQYRKARKLLQEFNLALENEKCFWYKTPQNLAQILKGVAADLEKISARLEQQINESSSDWADFQADDLFYEAAGQSYAYYQLLKSLTKDYKHVLVAENLYADWTKAIKALQDGVAVQPGIIRNGKLDAVWSANHLAALAYYIQKAENILLKTQTVLEGKK